MRIPDILASVLQYYVIKWYYCFYAVIFLTSVVNFLTYVYEAKSICDKLWSLEYQIQNIIKKICEKETDNTYFTYDIYWKWEWWNNFSMSNEASDLIWNRAAFSFGAE